MSIDTSVMELQVYPSAILKQKAIPVALPLPENIAEAADIMKGIMYNFEGIGLAGPQANLSQRIIVFDLSEERNDAQTLINPEITYTSKDKVKEEEGCLSFPEVNGYVIRHETVRVKGYNLAGEEVEYEGNGLMAAMFQHEIDHLDGITFVDRLGATGKMRVKRALKNLEEDYQG